MYKGGYFIIFCWHGWHALCFGLSQNAHSTLNKKVYLVKSGVLPLVMFM